MPWDGIERGTAQVVMWNLLGVVIFDSVVHRDVMSVSTNRATRNLRGLRADGPKDITMTRTMDRWSVRSHRLTAKAACR